MLPAASRRRRQPAPPHVIFEALTHPDSDPLRPWLYLRSEELTPTVVSAEAPRVLVWSSLWADRPDALIRFDLPLDAAGQGTDLRWTLLVDPPAPDPVRVRHMRARLDKLINADLRYTFGQ